ncbi:MAG: tryptophan synthase subunit alpha [Desulforhopalus sp.]|nr:tryptophan synthase subunit alpha [Desulforhopalus sp.]
MKLEENLRRRRENKEILLMTHLVLGYPDFDTNREVIAQMVENGVDSIELQIPFSEPVADGPVILKASQESIDHGTKVSECISFAKEMVEKWDIPFLFMTYYNIVFKYGEEAFFKKCAEIGITGVIVPDIPPEMGESFYQFAEQDGISPVLIFAPTSSDERMEITGKCSRGFVYCVPRKGVTGTKSEFGEELTQYLARCRKHTSLPLGVGFGIQSRADVEALIGKADIAIIGSKTIKLVDEKGAASVGPFIRHLLGEK